MRTLSFLPFLALVLAGSAVAARQHDAKHQSSATASIIDVIVNDQGGTVYDVTARFTYDGNGGKAIAASWTADDGFTRTSVASGQPLNGGFVTAEAQIPKAATAGTFTVSASGVVLASQAFTLP